MSLHCRPIVHVYCSGSSLVRWAYEVVYVEQGLKFVVEIEVKAIKLECCCMGASTPGVVHSTLVMDEYMVEMFGWSARNGIEVQKTREKMYTRRDEYGGTKRE